MIGPLADAGLPAGQPGVIERDAGQDVHGDELAGAAEDPLALDGIGDVLGAARK